MPRWKNIGTDIHNGALCLFTAAPADTSALQPEACHFSLVSLLCLVGIAIGLPLLVLRLNSLVIRRKYVVPYMTPIRGYLSAPRQLWPAQCISIVTGTRWSANASAQLSGALACLIWILFGMTAAPVHRRSVGATAPPDPLQEASCTAVELHRIGWLSVAVSYWLMVGYQALDVPFNMVGHSF